MKALSFFSAFMVLGAFVGFAQDNSSTSSERPPGVFLIKQKFGVRVEAIRQLDKLRGTTIVESGQLAIPAVPSPAAPTPVAEPVRAAAAKPVPKPVPKAAANDERALWTAMLRLPHPELLQLQVFLRNERFSPGLIDGTAGWLTARSLRDWTDRAADSQRSDSDPSDIVRNALEAARASNATATRPYVVTAGDLAEVTTPLPPTVEERSKLKWLGYASLSEMIAEKFSATASTLRLLNPAIDLDRLSAGDAVIVPAIRDPLPLRANLQPGCDAPSGTQAIFLIPARRTLQLVDTTTHSIIASFPATFGAGADQPKGNFQVTGIHARPDYTWDPAVLDGHAGPKWILPPGPRSPVGLVWVSLARTEDSATRLRVGIHGTCAPETLGKKATASHGCIRLLNTDAMTLARLIKPGTLVFNVEKSDILSFSQATSTASTKPSTAFPEKASKHKLHSLSQPALGEPSLH